VVPDRVDVELDSHWMGIEFKVSVGDIDGMDTSIVFFIVSLRMGIELMSHLGQSAIMVSL